MKRQEEYRIERNTVEKVRIVKNRKEYEKKQEQYRIEKNTVEKVRIVKNRKEYKRKGKNSIEQKGIRQKRLEQ